MTILGVILLVLGLLFGWGLLIALGLALILIGLAIWALARAGVTGNRNRHFW